MQYVNSKTNEVVEINITKNNKDYTAFLMQDLVDNQGFTYVPNYNFYYVEDYMFNNLPNYFNYLKSAGYTVTEID